MELTFEATFDGEVFRPTEEVNLKPNTKVTVTVDKTKTGKLLSSLEFMASLKPDSPSDFSKNIDDYLYDGKPLIEGEPSLS
jgi:predicted DNA-binding antitoxin AbrB/MazE fold protein